jgi:nucleoside-diphosphate-sugar epimerase/predicted O-methyltransferase YrrM
MKFLVLGSSGLIGKAFCKLLKNKGETVIPWDFKNGNQYDLRNNNNLDRLKDAVSQSDFVLFAAYDVGGAKYLNIKNYRIIENNMRIMSNTFSCLYGKKFIFLSTTMVFMKDQSYGVSKKLGEMYTELLNGLVVRLWNVYDNEKVSERSHVVADFVNSAINTGVINIMTDGEEQRQFLHADDCAEAFYHLFMNFDTFSNQPHIDLSSFEWISIKQIAEVVNEIIPCKINTGVLKDTYVKNEPLTTILNHIKPKINIKQGIQNIVDKICESKSEPTNHLLFLDDIISTTINGKGDSDKHLATLFALVLQTNAKNILELGVRKGVTTLPLLCGAKLTDGTVTSVDCNQTEFVCPDELRSRWTFHQSDALKFLEQSDRKWDLVFIDDWHSYDHVAKELILLDSRVTPSTVIVIHDLMYANYEPHYHTDMAVKSGQWANGGPYRAVAELNTNFWEFSTIPSCNGLTILRKKYSSLYK